jgi:chitin synthase
VSDDIVYLAVLGIQSVQQEGVTVDTVFGNSIFRNIVLSLLATYGLYIIASLLALEPWHMGELLSPILCSMKC